MSSIARDEPRRHLALLADDFPSDDAVDASSDATTAVVAHGLLGNLAVVQGVARLLIHDNGLDDAERARLLEMLDSQVGLMQGVLTDLIRGLPVQAITALDELGRR